MIQVHVPYVNERVTTPGPWRGHWNIGKYYNHAMDKADDWVIFCDDDTYRPLCPTRSWFHAFEAAIKIAGPKAGMITCHASRIGNALQRTSAISQPQPEDLKYHRMMAEAMYRKAGGWAIRRIDIGANYFSGFLFATNRAAWKKVGGFREGFVGVDVNYGKKLKKAGYEFWMIGGLYVFHGYETSGRKK